MKQQFTELFAGASIRGQSHIARHLPNQDAFFIQSYGFGKVFVVADGVGSKPYADIGSRAVVKAVLNGVKLWQGQEGATPKQLLQIIHALWELYIQPYEREHCATTCLFGVYLYGGQLILAQVGDGIIMFLRKDELIVLSEKEDDFLNTTKPIHKVRSYSEWSVQQFDVRNDSFMLLLGTDGVAEDIIEEERSAFMRYLCVKIAQKSTLKKRNTIIKKMLKHWGNRYNTDDKTLIIFNREAMQNADE
ncbi:PP2C family serine/threonine-protein phosphatase [Bacillus anthracis]|uniref:PP2C family serine/threonine-protein phosphatase n=1 Tax=Bacillus anthracis TaxID=1392 RepID=UPI002DBE2A55|nr:PP2C family serine/threonine-protein phosphatase [Bacillus anthracis]MEB9458417.1 PP2C family serine/threonine-protein phosphatase [Bacillus anthracis]